jgi:uncharacterized membrane protein YeaQ/YmgE (transglycosylase-associated protein family)
MILERVAFASLPRNDHRAPATSDAPPARPRFWFGHAVTTAAMHWIWLILVGALVGALGRLLHPGRDPMGWIVTILIGIASLVIAGLIFSSGWLEFLVGIVVAVILVALVGRFFGERRGDLVGT